MKLTAVTSPIALWQMLCLSAGLELRLQNGRLGRDADIEVALRKALAVPRTARSLDAWLAADAVARRPKVSVERFLVELLKGQQGFARMMQDILATLVAANAPHARHTLSIAFKFQDMHDPLVQTLEQFRESVLRTQKLLEARPRLPDSNTMWKIWHILNSVSPRAKGNQSNHFTGDPKIPSTGDPDLDKQIAQVALLVRDVQGLWKNHGADRHQVVTAAQAMYDQPHEDEKLRGQLLAASDYWDCSMIDSLQQLPLRIASRKLSPQTAHDELAQALSHLEWGDVWVERTFRELLDILALPAWQRRHELYSVWVGTRLVEVARAAEPSLRFNPVDGVLSFAFGGSRLATYEWQGKEYEIWAELRSTLEGTSPKRKDKIQPDFRVVQAGLTDTGNRTLYVLECKHYLRSSRGNFTTAAKDYARSCPNAAVHVVNHGPADDAALRAVLPPELQPSVRFIGDVQAGSEASTSKLCDAIRDALFPGLAAADMGGVPAVRVSAPAWPANCAGQVFLEWDGSLRDMDLSLHVISPDGTATQSIDFLRMGSLDRPPFAHLIADVHQGPGFERIDIGTWHFAHYELIATNYSGYGAMTPEALKCRVVTSAGTTLLQCPRVFPLSQHEWRIAELIVRGDAIDIVPIDAPH